MRNILMYLSFLYTSVVVNGSKPDISVRRTLFNHSIESPRIYNDLLFTIIDFYLRGQVSVFDTFVCIRLILVVNERTLSAIKLSQNDN